VLLVQAGISARVSEGPPFEYLGFDIPLIFFKACDLNLDKLASLTGINKYHLSETLNGFVGKSFYQYINEYRVSYALKQMESMSSTRGEDFNVLSLAYKSGFKAKSSFNRYFKEITGFTPSEYQKVITESNVALT
jgi:AraC-like DNA-binding protein